MRYGQFFLSKLWWISYWIVSFLPDFNFVTWWKKLNHFSNNFQKKKIPYKNHQYIAKNKIRAHISCIISKISLTDWNNFYTFAPEVSRYIMKQQQQQLYGQHLNLPPSSDSCVSRVPTTSRMWHCLNTFFLFLVPAATTSAFYRLKAMLFILSHSFV